MPVQKTDRDEIIRKSLNVFREKGYHKTTMADLAAASGLLKGSMYHYFSGKEELMAEVLTRLRDHYVKNVFSIAYDNRMSPVSRLKKLATFSEELFMQNTGGCFMVNIGLETIHSTGKFNLIIRDFFNEWVNCIAYIYRFIYKASEAEANARAAVAEIEGAVVLMQIFNDPGYLIRTHKDLISRYRKAAKTLKVAS